MRLRRRQDGRLRQKRRRDKQTARGDEEEADQLFISPLDVLANQQQQQQPPTRPVSPRLCSRAASARPARRRPTWGARKTDQLKTKRTDSLVRSKQSPAADRQERQTDWPDTLPKLEALQSDQNVLQFVSSTSPRSSASGGTTTRTTSGELESIFSFAREKGAASQRDAFLARRMRTNKRPLTLCLQTLESSASSSFLCFFAAS